MVLSDPGAEIILRQMTGIRKLDLSPTPKVADFSFAKYYGWSARGHLTLGLNCWSFLEYETRSLPKVQLFAVLFHRNLERPDVRRGGAGSCASSSIRLIRFDHWRRRNLDGEIQLEVTGQSRWLHRHNWFLVAQLRLPNLTRGQAPFLSGIERLGSRD
jgi:hypothetical protein